MHWYWLLLVFFAGLFAGGLNSVAGGGSFLTFPALLIAGINPLAANICSTVGLFPGQTVIGLGSRKFFQPPQNARFIWLIIVSLLGGVCGAFLLLSTPVSDFTHIVPFLIGFATLAFIWGTFRKSDSGTEGKALPVWVILGAQFLIAVYGGYFGGGIGILMLALFTLSGVALKGAIGLKNILAIAMNAVAFVIFVFSGKIVWIPVLVLVLGTSVGGYFGVRVLTRIPAAYLKKAVILIGIGVTIGMFVHYR